ncbi:hypothetical protein [Corynebacterium aquilae]|uniref:Uncharacterized protein n=1 Tax=Corynebacterium aquilae DSM 44791 TaxID=1431546 RepID=A0A1L7CGC3_9CORY|nr:hypothetical protein [Corynebacterium aquilae]APT84912.1 hypothetical protein CAQU_07365 [Corynebacterium aquilae DSM 44791]
MTARTINNAMPSTSTAVFEPGRLPSARVSSGVRTVTVHYREPARDNGADSRRFSSILLGGTFGMVMGLAFLILGPAPDDSPQMMPMGHETSLTSIAK